MKITLTSMRVTWWTMVGVAISLVAGLYNIHGYAPNSRYLFESYPNALLAFFAIVILYFSALRLGGPRLALGCVAFCLANIAFFAGGRAAPELFWPLAGALGCSVLWGVLTLISRRNWGWSAIVALAIWSGVFAVYHECFGVNLARCWFAGAAPALAVCAAGLLEWRKRSKLLRFWRQMVWPVFVLAPLGAMAVLGLLWYQYHDTMIVPWVLPLIVFGCLFFGNYALKSYMKKADARCGWAVILAATVITLQIIVVEPFEMQKYRMMQVSEIQERTGNE